MRSDKLQYWLAPCLALAVACSSEYSELPEASGENSIASADGLEGKFMVGYQGWFGTAGEGSRRNRWSHWSAGGPPAAGNLQFDAWPDTSEYEALYPTNLNFANGKRAQVFSSYDRSTIDLHVKWMRDYGIDGLFLQRFNVALRSPEGREFRDTIARHVKRAAEKYGRVYAIMYDISGAQESTLVEDLLADWRRMVDEGVTNSGRYLKHRGRPVVSIWGLGFDGRPGSAAQAKRIIDYLQGDAPPRYQATVMGGVPTHWRTLDRDSKTNPAWREVYASFDVLSPWTVGRYATDQDVERFRRDVLAPDMSEARSRDQDYLPVIFPGFSFQNHKGTGFNRIPRRGGRFFWKQAHEFSAAGATMLYGAMFDEVDEGTALFKLAARRGDAPQGAEFLTLDADGETLPSDWYLRLCDEIRKRVAGQAAWTANIPISPNQAPNDSADPDDPVDPPPPPGDTFVVSRTYHPQSGERSVAFPGHQESGHQIDGPTFRAFPNPGPGLRALYTCRRGTDNFVSQSAQCEGSTFVKLVGYVYQVNAAGRTAIQRCRNSAGEWFVSREVDCEGQVVIPGVLGFF